MDQDHGAACLTLLEEIGELGALRREMARCAAPELHPGAAAVVWHLAEHGPLRMSDLAAGLRLDLSVVSRQAGELVAAGHVVRRPDPADRRACLLSLTDSGRTVLDAAHSRLAERFGAQLAGWPTEDLLRTAAILRRLRADLLPPAGGAPAPANLRTTALASS